MKKQKKNKQKITKNVLNIYYNNNIKTKKERKNQILKMQI